MPCLFLKIPTRTHLLSISYFIHVLKNGKHIIYKPQDSSDQSQWQHLLWQSEQLISCFESFLLAVCDKMTCVILNDLIMSGKSAIDGNGCLFDIMKQVKYVKEQLENLSQHTWKFGLNFLFLSCQEISSVSHSCHESQLDFTSSVNSSLNLEEKLSILSFILSATSSNTRITDNSTHNVSLWRF